MDDLEFADDVALLPHSYNQMQEKTTQMEESAGKLGFSVGKGEVKSIRMNTTNNSLIMLEKGAIENVSSFTYLGSIVGHQRRNRDEDVKVKIGKAIADIQHLAENMEV